MIKLRTLGSCVIEVGETAVGPEAERLFGVLLYLTTERGRRTARRCIQELLWPEASEEHGRHNLRQVIYKLRQYGVELGGGTRDVYLPASQVTADPFDALTGDAASAGDALLGGDVGEYLAGYAPTFSEPYARWVEGQRAYAHARIARAAVAAMLERRARGRWADVERLAQLCLRYDPLNEEATLGLAESTALAGSKARALAILDQYIAELGDSTSIQLPATLLRRRIAERLPDPPYTAPSEACFVGRDESLRYLHELLGHARAGRGQCCMIVGEPGVGKSRLAAEFARVATLQGAQLQHLGCQPRDVARPLSLFADGVPALLKLPGAIGCSPRSMSYLKRLIEHDPSATSPSEDSREAEYLYANVRRAVLDLVDAIAAERTLLLVIDDVQWADPASWDVLRDLIAWCPGRKVLLVLTSRVAHVPLAAVERLPLRLHHIAPLPGDAAAKLLDALVDERQRRPSDQLRGWLIRAADGNALFLRELVIHWLETGREGAVPPSLGALFGERLSRLTPLALRIFQTCAVMGNRASFERLELALEYKRHEVLDGLQELEAAGLLRSRAGGVQSRHELLADAAVGELADAARRYLHRQVALVLEPQVLQAAPADASVLWECAEHWIQAGDLGRAWKITTACGAYLLEVGLPALAAEVYERAQVYADTDAEKHECRAGLAAAFIHGGKWENAQRVLSELVESSRGSGVATRQHFEAELQLLYADLQMGADVIELRERSRVVMADRSLDAGIRVKFGLAALSLADHTCSPASLVDSFSLISECLLHPSVPEAERATAKMIYYTASGDLTAALAAAQRLVAERRSTRSSPSALAHALRCAGHVATRSAQHEAAVAYLLESTSIAEEYNLVTQAIRSCGMLSEHYFDALDLAEAKAWHARAVRWAGVGQDPVLSASNAVLNAKIALAEGHIDYAESLLGSGATGVLGATLYDARMQALAAQLHLATARLGAAVPTALIEEFTSQFDQLISSGGLDYPAVVRFCYDLHVAPAYAYDRLVEYVRLNRVEGAPLPALLTRTLVDRQPPFVRSN